MLNNEEKIEALYEALLSMEKPKVEAILTSDIQPESPEKVIDALLVPALEKIGNGWAEGAVSLSQIYMSGRIAEDLIDKLFPLKHLSRPGAAKMAIVVLDDYHLLGKRIVYSLLRSAGYDLLDYGRMTADQIPERVKKDGVDILLVSVLMLESALKISALRESFDKLGLKTKIIVGGAPFIFDTRLWQEVHADAMGKNAAEAIEVIKRLQGGVL